MNRFLPLLIKWLEKAPIPSAAGHHEHSGISGQHPIEQHHRFEHRSVMSNVNREFTVPEKYWEHPDFSEDPERLTGINLSDIARAHNVDLKSFSRALYRDYGRGLGFTPEQLVRNEYYDPKTERFIKITEKLLSPAQVQMAHQAATEVKRKSSHRSMPPRTINKPDVFFGDRKKDLIPKREEPLFA